LGHHNHHIIIADGAKGQGAHPSHLNLQIVELSKMRRNEQRGA
jgi:hypothetical protein